MVMAERLKALREQKNMSQGDIERRTGLLRCYISRVENGHTASLRLKLWKRWREHC
jgi:transcriptional regulator with XRE-family HTH domain